MTALSDRLHPIVVRDVKTALRSQTYLITMAFSCVAVVVIAMFGVDREARGLEVPQWTLRATLWCLVPILFFVIPVRAFTALRDEVETRTADSLVLTRLQPASILLGMLQAAMLQVLMFLAVFAPLFAACYLLLAVDVFTLLQLVWLLGFGSMAAISLAFGVLWLQRFEALRDHVPLLAILISAVTPVWVLGELDSLVLALESFARAANFVLLALRQVSVLVFVSIALCMLGASQLTAFQATREVSFRILGLAAAPTATVLCGDGLEGVPVACVLLLPFWFHAVTGRLDLTRRQRILIPSEHRRAARAFVLLPGSARGFVYAVVLAALVLVTGFVTQTLAVGSMSIDAAFGAFAAAEYLVLFAGIYTLVRYEKFEQSAFATTSARMRILPLTICFLAIWSIGDALLSFAIVRLGFMVLGPANPIVTFSGHGWPMVPTALALVLVLLVVWVKVRSLVASSWAEVMKPARSAKARATSIGGA